MEVKDMLRILKLCGIGLMRDANTHSLPPPPPPPFTDAEKLEMVKRYLRMEKRVLERVLSKLEE